MPIKLTLHSFEYESYIGATVFAHDNPGDVLGTHKSAVLESPSPGVLEANFGNLAINRNWFFYGKEGSRITWRSGPIRVENANQEIALRIFAILSEQTTFTEDQMQDEMDLPIVKKVFPEDDNSTKMVSIDALSVNIRTNDLRLTGSGIVGDENEDGEIMQESGLTFDYRIRIKPTSLYFSTDRFLNVEPVENPEVTFDNPITGIMVGIYNFFTGAVDKSIEKSVERALNNAIKEEMEDQLNDLSEDDAERIVATVQQVELLDGEQIRFTVVLCMPSEIFQQKVKEGCANKGAVFVFAAVGLLIGLLLW
ncbi:MAG: hypothetical protein IPJ00_04205 [Saprospirales bacterium]|nr:hypothetical protein [Saprospirales bacterium]